MQAIRTLNGTKEATKSPYLSTIPEAMTPSFSENPLIRVNSVQLQTSKQT